MILGNPKNLIFLLVFLFTDTMFTFAADKIESVPLINLEELSPTFEEDKDELEKIEKIEKIEKQNGNLTKTEDAQEKSEDDTNIEKSNTLRNRNIEKYNTREEF